MHAANTVAPVPNILVLGIGNLLLQDEGIGVHVVERLQTRYRLPENVCALDGGTSGMTLLDDLAACQHLLVVDCGRLDAPPGSVREFFGDAVPAFFQQRISPHQIGLSDLLAAAALIDALPAGLSLIAIEPECIELGTEMSATGERACELALERVIARLNALGAAPTLLQARVA
jgi:hydrogenase maturation protease